MADERPIDAPPARAPADPRLRGFADRVTLERAQAWIDGRAVRLPPVEVDAAVAAGRVLAAPVVAAADHPPAPRAGEDGYAVRAADTVGASTYNPLSLRPEGAAGPLGPGAAALVAAGTSLPQGADAVLGFDAAQEAGGGVECIAPAAPGGGVEARGRQARAGAILAAAAQRLRAQDAAWLASLGVARVSAVGRPRIRIAVAGAKREGGAAAPDAHLLLLAALVARDGGELEPVPVASGLRDALRRALAPPAPDLVIVTGRTGAGPDDDAPGALAELGELAIHGVALRPGGSAALGTLAGITAALLPGDPLACLVVYELIAGRLVRAAAGLAPGLPHRRRDARLARKLVSTVGVTEVCQVRLAAGEAEPLGAHDFGGLATAARADGFVVVPAPLEGYPAGEAVTVHEY